MAVLVGAGIQGSWRRLRKSTQELVGPRDARAPGTVEAVTAAKKTGDPARPGPSSGSGRQRPSGADSGPWQRRLHVVTGKGGTGKTTVAGALALALATGGKRVLLAEVEGRQQIAQVFDTPPLAYRERKVASAPGGGEVYALAVDAEEALLEYLEMFYNLRGAGKVLGKIGAIDFATTIAPGVRDVLLTGKIKEAVNRPDGTRPDGMAYDAVVLDAPPTGQVTRFLNVAHEVAGLAKMGPIRSQADGVLGVLHSGQTAVHLVTLLEEMPVQETIDAVGELRAQLHRPADGAQRGVRPARRGLRGRGQARPLGRRRRRAAAGFPGRGRADRAGRPSGPVAVGPVPPPQTRLDRHDPNLYMHNADKWDAKVPVRILISRSSAVTLGRRGRRLGVTRGGSRRRGRWCRGRRCRAGRRAGGGWWAPR